MGLCPASQASQLRALFASKEGDEEEKVQHVMALYDNIGLRPEVERAIDDQFRLAVDCLDSIAAAEHLKLPFRQLMETLSGRKK